MERSSGSKRRIATPPAIESATIPATIKIKIKTKSKTRTKATEPGSSETSAKPASPPKPHAEASESGEDVQDWINRRATAQATRAANARQVSGRRRFVDPTTCERDYTNAEMEFMQAMHEYKISSGRMFPTWSEVLEVLKSLGYEKAGMEALSAAVAGMGVAHRV